VVDPPQGCDVEREASREECRREEGFVGIVQALELPAHQLSQGGLGDELAQRRRDRLKDLDHGWIGHRRNAVWF
jgi:hypothetical protein